MRFLLHTTLLAAAIFLLSLNTGTAQFRNGGSWLGPAVTLATDPVGFGLNFERGVSKDIGIGALVRYWGQSETYLGRKFSRSIIMPQFQAAYHFMPGNQLDPFAGGRLGWAIVNITYDTGDFSGSLSGSSGLFLTAYGGLRYFFSPSISGNGTMEFQIAGEDYFGTSLELSVGVDFTL